MSRRAPSVAAVGARHLVARDHGEGDDEGEEQLRETAVHDGQRVLEQDDS